MERFLKIIYRIFKDKFQGEIPQNAQQRSDCQPSTSTEGQSPRCNDEGSGSTRPSSHDPREEDRTETRMDSESRIVHEPDFDPYLMPRFTDPTEKYYEKPKNE
ncbi:uncharacterized protein LOC128998446 [Macrosteles quadrilineatus]|uniref:uncharacterized protein LOC128998446 n=1 Tax=Macrosteles quadrilineatus TaxID=74068 RepID=UPI0023E23C0F|nr:uncharacterized protein LOC128998446 [Macrosteles quadrilineatus]